MEDELHINVGPKPSCNKWDEIKWRVMDMRICSVLRYLSCFVQCHDTEIEKGECVKGGPWPMYRGMAWIWADEDTSVNMRHPWIP